MFYGQNKSGFQLVSVFLMSQVQIKMTELRSCFPCRDHKQEADFRRIINDYLTHLHVSVDHLVDDDNVAFVSHRRPIRDG